MITTRLYLDSRAPRAGGECPVKIQINKRSKTALLATGICVLPSQWDKASLSVVRHPSRGVLNTRIQKLKIRVDDMIYEMILSGRASEMTVTDIKREIQDALFGVSAETTLRDVAEAFLEPRKEPTRKIYRESLNRVMAFDPASSDRPVQGFSEAWCQRFDAYLQQTYSATTRRLTIGHLSAVLNSAVKAGKIKKNPLSCIKLGAVITRKRSLSREQFCRLWHYTPETDIEQRSLDFFKLSFLLIAINPVDLCALTDDNIYNGRVEYVRSKTKKHYSVKIIDEAKELLTKYRKGRLLCWPLPGFEAYYDMTGRVDRTLTLIGHKVGIAENVTMYWARHSWATFAAQLDIPVDVISAGLGHSHGEKVTMVYVALDMKKVDDAHRRVVDYATTNPGDSHRPGRTTEITND